MIDLPDFSRLPPMTRDGRLTEEGWQQLQRLVDALRELQAASADHETRIADLEP